MNAAHLSRIPIPIPAADASLQSKPLRKPVVGDCSFHIETVTVAPTFAVVFHKVGTGHVAARCKLFEMPSHFLFIVGQAMPQIGVAVVIRFPEDMSPIVWGRSGSNVLRDIVVVVGGVEMKGQADLFKVVGAVNPVSRFFGFAQRRAGAVQPKWQ